MSRRALLGALLGLVPLGGCGFRPVHAPGRGEGRAAAPASAALAAELAAVRVAPMYERYGQLFRRSLQNQLEGRAPGTAARYLLTVAVQNEAEPLGYRQDGTITRIRMVSTARWTLTTDAIPPVPIEQGSARTLDSFNIPDLQFYAAEISREAMDRRLIEELSDRVVQGVAIALGRRLRA
ncbi:LPS assembly lipoprotein LptE [Roseococcus sp. DSY-14]|uniref:LPS assembly lipoprotein LptE n=1 Tax=Roseococcus sp. DSY-14 TaxID=3369650 RepID=UPI00387B64B7